MKKAAVKTIKLEVYPETEAAKKYVTRDATFEIFVADHAYLRNQQRLEEVYKKYAREFEGRKEFFERVACEACVKILNIGKPPTDKGMTEMIRYNFIWVFDFKRNPPALVTVYPYDKNWRSKKPVLEKKILNED